MNSVEVQILRLLQDNTNDAVIVIDSNGKIISSNNNAQKLYEYSTEDFSQILFTQLLDLSDNEEKYFQDSENAVYIGYHLKKTGEKIAVEVKNVPFGTLNEQFNILILRELLFNDQLKILKDKIDTYNDKEKNHQENLKKLEVTKEDVEKVILEKKTFIENIDYEFRTPLNGIMGVVQLLQLSGTNEEQANLINMLRSSIESLVSVVNNLYNNSIIDIANKPPEAKSFDLQQVIRTMVDEMKLLWKNKKIEILYYIDPFMETVLMGDCNKIKQIILYLIHNANKNTKKGQISLNVKKASNDSSNLMLQFSIEDSGKGMTEKEIQEIYNQFNNESTNLSKESDQNFILNAKKIVDLLNGEIWIDSKKGKGTTVFFTVEVKLPHKVDEFKISIPDIEDQVGKNMNKDYYKDKKVILVVEDNLINQRITSGMVRKMGFEPIIANNGKEALNILEKNKVDAILMDIQMPVMDGCEATKNIRQNESENLNKIPIIALTAYALPGDREKFLEIGMNEYLSKPVKYDDLLNTISKFIEITNF